MAATPIIRTSQLGVVVTGVGREDLVTGSAVSFSDTVGANTGATYSWQLEDRPPGSSATITNPTTATPSLTPDVTGSYRIRCTVNGSFFSAVIIGVPLPNSGARMPAYLETDVFPTAYTGGGNTKGWHTAMVQMFRAFDAAISPLPDYGLIGDIAAVGASSAAGTSPKLARADHAHAHGNQGGGSLHANVVAGGASGFMTGAQATALAAATVDIATMSSTVVGHTSSIATLTSGLSTANSNIATNTSNIASLTSTVGGHTSAISTLQGRTLTTTAPLQGGGAIGTTNLTLTIAAATGSAPGSMAAADFTKVQGIVALTTKGDLMGFSTGPVRVPVGSNGQTIVADSTVGPGWKWTVPTVDVTQVTGGTDGFIPYFDPAGALSVSTGLYWDSINSVFNVLGSSYFGGTVILVIDGQALTFGSIADGQVFRRVGSDIVGAAATPLTTKGDLFGFTTVPARIGVGSNGQTIVADSTAGPGWKWAAPTVPFGNVRGGDPQQIPFFGSDGALTSSGNLTWNYDDSYLYAANIVVPNTLTVQAGATLSVEGTFAATETGGPTLLTLGAVADGEFFKRVGSSIVGATPAVGGSGADALGRYIVQIATNAPSNAQVLASLATGYVKNTITTGVLTTVATLPYTDVGGGTAKQIPFFDGSGKLTKTADLTWDGFTLYGEGGADARLLLSTTYGVTLASNDNNALGLDGTNVTMVAATGGSYTLFGGANQRFKIDEHGNVFVGNIDTLAGGSGMFALADRVEEPASGNTTHGLVLFSRGGELKSKGEEGGIGNHYRMLVYQGVNLVTGYPGINLPHDAGITPAGVWIQQHDTAVEYSMTTTNVTFADDASIQIESSADTVADVVVLY